MENIELWFDIWENYIEELGFAHTLYGKLVIPEDQLRLIFNLAQK